jgi:signal peptidase I
LFVKRVVGMPGDLLREGNGWIYVNGKRLEEAYIGADARKADANDSFTGPARVPTKSYFAIGDNRSESCDSRTWGSVPASNIVGVVTQIIRQRS